MDISIVVPTFNRRKIVTDSLQSLFAQDFPPARFEIIVVVDGSTDGTAAALNHLAASRPFRIIEQENRGLAGARNTGFRAAQSDLVLFLDDDMRCDPGLISAHVNAHQRFGPGVVFGALFLTSDSRANLAAECFNRELGAFHLHHRADSHAPVVLSNCTFSNASIPREILAEAAGFDEQFRMREDLELAIRLQEKGTPMHYEPAAIARQFYDKTAANLLADAERFAVSDVKLAQKHPEQLIEGHVTSLANDRGWKATLRNGLAGSPVGEKLLLAPICSLGEAFFGITLLRNLGVRALQIRRRVHWLRVVKRLTYS
jgi:glycosyltransferase involved in cell wall biosynthesis